MAEQDSPAAGSGDESEWSDADDDGSGTDALGAGARLAAVIVGLALVLALVAGATAIGVAWFRDDGTNGGGRAETSELFVINLDDDQVIIVERDDGDGGGVSGDLFVVRLQPEEEADVAGIVSSSQQCTTQDLVALDPDGNELGTLDAETCYDDGRDWTVDP